MVKILPCWQTAVKYLVDKELCCSQLMGLLVAQDALLNQKCLNNSSCPKLACLQGYRQHNPRGDNCSAQKLSQYMKQVNGGVHIFHVSKTQQAAVSQDIPRDRFFKCCPGNRLPCYGGSTGCIKLALK